MARINIELRQLHALIAVAEEGRFSAAAQRIHLSQPALSLLIKQMEENLGLRLFHRTTRKVELTAAGQTLLATARRIHGELDEGLAQLRDLADSRRGRVAIAALPSLAATLLAEALPGFRAAHPGVRVSLRDGVADNVVAALKNGEVDFAIGLPMRAEDDLVDTPLLVDELVAISRPGTFASATLTWQALAREPLVAMARGTSIRRLTDQALGQLAQQTGQGGEPAPEPAYEVAYMATALALVENGEGVTVLPSSALPATLPPQLQRHTLDGPRIHRQICILERKGRQRAPAVVKMVDHLLRFTAGWRQTDGRPHPAAAPGAPP